MNCFRSSLRKRKHVHYVILLCTGLQVTVANAALSSHCGMRSFMHETMPEERPTMRFQNPKKFSQPISSYFSGKIIYLRALSVIDPTWSLQRHLASIDVYLLLAIDDCHHNQLRLSHNELHMARLTWSLRRG